VSRVIERISELWSQWFDGLSGRERRMLGIVFAALCVVLVFATFYVATTKIQTKRDLLSKNQELLNQIKDLEGEYSLAKQKNEEIIENIRHNDVSLFTFIQAITSNLGLTVKNLAEQKRPLGKSNIIEISVRLNLTKLSIDKVTALVEAIETDEDHAGHVKVTKMKISKSFSEPDLLDLQMTISTWKSA